MSVIVSRLVQQGGVVSGGPSTTASTYTALRAISNPNNGDLCIYTGTGIGDHGSFKFNTSSGGAGYVAIQSQGTGTWASFRTSFNNVDGHNTNIDVCARGGKLVFARIDQITAGATPYAADSIDYTIPDQTAAITLDFAAHRPAVGDTVTIVAGSTVTFTYVASGATGNQVNQGGSITADANNLRDAINSAFSGVLSAAVSTGLSSAVVVVTAVAAGPTANAYTMAYTSATGLLQWRITNPTWSDPITTRETIANSTTVNFSGGTTGGVIRCYRDNGGTHISPNAGAEPRGRWERQMQGLAAIDARHFGFSSAAADNTAAVMAADSASWFANNSIHLPGTGGNAQLLGASCKFTQQLSIGSALIGDADLSSSYATVNDDCFLIYNAFCVPGGRGRGLSFTSSRNAGNVADRGATVVFIPGSSANIQIYNATSSHLAYGIKCLGSDPRVGRSGGASYFSEFTGVRAAAVYGYRASLIIEQEKVSRSIDDGSNFRLMKFSVEEANVVAPPAADNGFYAHAIVAASGARNPGGTHDTKLDSCQIKLSSLEGVSTVGEYHKLALYAGSNINYLIGRFDTSPTFTAGQAREGAGALVLVCPRDGPVKGNRIGFISGDTGAIMSRTSLRAAAAEHVVYVEMPDPAVQPSIFRWDGNFVVPGSSVNTATDCATTYTLDIADKWTAWGTEAASVCTVPGLWPPLAYTAIGGGSFHPLIRSGYINFGNLPAGTGTQGCPYIEFDTRQHKSFFVDTLAPEAGPRSFGDAVLSATRTSPAQWVVEIYDFQGRLIPSGGTSGNIAPNLGNAIAYANGQALVLNDCMIYVIGYRTHIYRCIKAGTLSTTPPSPPAPFETLGTADVEYMGQQFGDIHTGPSLNPNNGYTGYRLTNALTFSVSHRVAMARLYVEGGLMSGVRLSALDTGHTGAFRVHEPPAISRVGANQPPQCGRYYLGQTIVNSNVTERAGWACTTAGYCAYSAWTTGTVYERGQLVSSNTGANIFEVVSGASKFTMTGPANAASTDRVCYDIISLGSGTAFTVSGNPGSTATYDVKHVISAISGDTGSAETSDTFGGLSVATDGTCTYTPTAGHYQIIRTGEILRLTGTSVPGGYAPTITVQCAGGALENPASATAQSTVDPNSISGQPSERMAAPDGYVWAARGAVAVFTPFFDGFKTVNVSSTTDTVAIAGMFTLRWLTNASACTVTLPQISTVSQGARVRVYQSQLSANPTIATTGGDTVSGAVTWGANKCAEYVATAATVWTATQIY